MGSEPTMFLRALQRTNSLWDLFVFGSGGLNYSERTENLVMFVLAINCLNLDHFIIGFHLGF